MSPNPTGSVTPNQASHQIDQACLHLDAAATQLAHVTAGDPFAPARALAAHINLLRAALGPPSDTTEPAPTCTPIEHLDVALTLLDTVPTHHAPPDLRLWSQQLARLRTAVIAATATTETDNSEQP